ncbi:hypothetical protein M2454_001280 [Aequitasia blattaphilus]|uniref:DUF5688 family protein n=2 Tax=Aequitasia blattaphilus TaxID=2949332 RepID=A0ABT1E7I7_9FIRM|nr:DUF5688 family protein [Aequitasia blattaphilus]MCR8614388.1 DUF5688 family protein [Aequitasia blattaphilus]
MSSIELEEVKDRIIFQLINPHRNQELLRDTPHILYLDLAIVFCVYYEQRAMIIKENLSHLWKLNTETLYRIARENTERLLPSDFTSIEEVLTRLTGCEMKPEEEIMYILSNKQGIWGAASILYQGELKEIGKTLEEDYYVLPSSIHEVIIVPKSKAISREDLDAMIQEINETQVGEQEVLSNHAYYYNREKEELMS